MRSGAAVSAPSATEFEPRGGDMNLTNLEDQTREAVLFYYDAESILGFHKFNHDMGDKPALDEDSTPSRSYLDKKCEELSKIYTDVIFSVSDHRIVAKVKEGVEGSLVEQIGFVSRQIPQLETTLRVVDDPISIIFRADGVVILREGSEYEFFRHDIVLEEVIRDCEGDKDAMDDYLQNYFDEHILSEMKDPFFDPSDGCPLYFETGSGEELRRLMTLFILTEPGIEAHEDEDVILYAANGEDGPHLEEERYYYSKRLEKLTEIAVSENRPVGWTYEYNDGVGNRRSGYDESPESLIYRISEVIEDTPARVKMAARRHLRIWLQERGRDLTKIDELGGPAKVESGEGISDEHRSAVGTPSLDTSTGANDFKDRDQQLTESIRGNNGIAVEGERTL
jgi:hypothetical protein